MEEQCALAPAGIPPGVFVRVELQVLGADVPVDALYPALQVRPQVLHVLGVAVGRVELPRGVVRAPVLEPVPVQQGVGLPPVGVHQRVRRDVLPDQGDEHPRPGRPDVPYPGLPVALHHPEEHLARPVSREAVGRPRGGTLVDVGVHVGLVDLYLPAERLVRGGHHTAYEPEHAPGRLVGHAYVALQLGGAVPGLVRAHGVYGVEPVREGGGGAVEDGSREREGVASAPAAGVGAPSAHPVVPRRTAGYAGEALRIEVPDEPREAGPVVGKVGVELLQGVFVQHTAYYYTIILSLEQYL